MNLKDIAPFVYSTTETLESSFNIGKYIVDNNIKGDIVECGIANGAQLAAIMRGTNNTRKAWGFDSFEGIQRAGKKDTEQAGIGKITHDVNVDYKELLVSTGITCHNLGDVAAKFKVWGLENNITLVKGWVQNTLPNNTIKDIAVLRLDMDIYHPTKVALDLLYDKVVKGGVIIIDDWNLQGCQTAVYEFLEERKIKVEFNQVKNSSPIFWYK